MEKSTAPKSAVVSWTNRAPQVFLNNWHLSQEPNQAGVTILPVACQ